MLGVQPKGVSNKRKEMESDSLHKKKNKKNKSFTQDHFHNQ